ncbi:hypothetical protein Salat_1032200 [Sesamum alatum]|uniref:Uncharacterized protein n=1 Tax=Sesamum alatum TaxID=300844 RepID=A0AAE1YM24_9LAMI|nr:hypothetical protein Salat_1032200 [Sesamum alatum]
MLKNRETRDNEFNNEKQQAQSLPPPPPLLVPSLGLATVMQQQIGDDDQFIRNMLEERDITEVLGVSPNVGDVAHSTGGKNDRGVEMLPGGTSLRSNNDVAS